MVCFLNILPTGSTPWDGGFVSYCPSKGANSTVSCGHQCQHFSNRLLSCMSCHSIVLASCSWSCALTHPRIKRLMKCGSRRCPHWYKQQWNASSRRKHCFSYWQETSLRNYHNWQWPHTKSAHHEASRPPQSAGWTSSPARGKDRMLQGAAFKETSIICGCLIPAPVQRASGLYIQARLWQCCEGQYQHNVFAAYKMSLKMTNL